jgi:hypothetical protein
MGRGKEQAAQEPHETPFEKKWSCSIFFDYECNGIGRCGAASFSTEMLISDRKSYQSVEEIPKGEK